MMKTALLIQDVSEFLTLLKRAQRDIREPFAHYGILDEELFDWIIREQIENVYCIQTAGHHYKAGNYRHLYYLVKNYFLGDLDRYTKAFIQVPELYGESEISVELSGIDLLIRYKKPGISLPKRNYCF